MKKLIYVEGNLLTYPGIEIIGHQCNTSNTFGSGLALQIKKKYPQAFEADAAAFRNHWAKLGNISYTSVVRDQRPFVIFNLYGQERYGFSGRNTNYEGLFVALEKMRNLCERMRAPCDVNQPAPTIGFPYQMGSYRGGGDWRIVERLIEVAFSGYPANVYCVKYHEEEPSWLMYK